MSRAVQLAAAAIAAVSVDAQTQTESQDDLIEKRTAVRFTRIRFEQHCVELNPDNNNNSFVCMTIRPYSNAKAYISTKRNNNNVERI